MNGGLITLGWVEIALVGAMVVAAVLLSLLLRLGLARELMVAAVRATLQLGAVGLVIGWVFRQHTWYWVVSVLGLMAIVAGTTAGGRLGMRGAGARSLGWMFSALLAGATALVTGYLAWVVLGIDEWQGRYLIPLWGMLLGNAMTAVTLAGERLSSGLREGAGEVEGLLALGATAEFATRGPRRAALRAALTPTLNAMMVVGLVKLPGMMTGQILGGSPPFQAAMYQLMIFLGIALCDLLSSSAAVWLLQRRYLTRHAQVHWARLRGEAG